MSLKNQPREDHQSKQHSSQQAPPNLGSLAVEVPKGPPVNLGVGGGGGGTLGGVKAKVVEAEMILNQNFVMGSGRTQRW